MQVFIYSPASLGYSNNTPSLQPEINTKNPKNWKQQNQPSHSLLASHGIWPGNAPSPFQHKTTH